MSEMRRRTEEIQQRWAQKAREASTSAQEESGKTKEFMQDWEAWKQKAEKDANQLHQKMVENLEQIKRDIENPPSPKEIVIRLKTFFTNP